MPVRVINGSANFASIRATWNRPPDRITGMMGPEAFEPGCQCDFEPVGEGCCGSPSLAKPTQGDVWLPWSDAPYRAAGRTSARRRLGKTGGPFRPLGLRVHGRRRVASAVATSAGEACGSGCGSREKAVPYGPNLTIDHLTFCPGNRVPVCCVAVDQNGNESVVRDDAGNPISFPFCHPTLCSPAYRDQLQATLDAAEFQRVSDLLDEYCPQIGDTFDESDMDKTCYHPLSYQCQDPPVVVPGQNVLDVAGALADVTFSGEIGLAAVHDLDQFFATVLAFLRANLDLVKYACCLHFGPNNDVCDCVVDALLGTVELVIEKQLFRDSGGCVQASSRGDAPGTLNIYPSAITAYEPECPAPTEYPTADDWATAVAVGDDEAALCVLATWAGILVHEMMHDCITTDEGSHEDDIHTYDWLGEVGTEEQQDECDPTSDFALSRAGDTIGLEDMLRERYGLAC